MNKLKITIRNAWNNKVLSFAKIFGMSLSFAVILFSVVYAYYESSFDKTIPDNEKIYRCLMQGQLNKEVVDFAVTSSAQAPAMVNEIPEISDAIRLFSRGDASINYNNENIDKGPLYDVDSGFFDFFGIKCVTEVDDPLASKNSVVIARSIAEMHFGTVSDALGKSVKIRNEGCIITGVFDDLPSNFHLRIEMVQSIQKSLPKKTNWNYQNFFTYIKTKHTNIDNDELNFKISKTAFTHTYDNIDGAAATSWDDLKFTDNMFVFFTAEPLSDIHFSKHKFDPAVTSTKTYVYGAMVLALLILIISSVNFINLTVANISTRLKELGIRKTIGANRSDVRFQLMFETTFFISVSFIIASLFYLLAGEELAKSIGIEITVPNMQLLMINAIVFVCILFFILVVTFIPINLSSNKNILTLIKGDINTKKHSWGNNVFLLIQFVLSALIILSSVIVQKQIDYIVNKNRGYDTENVMMFRMWSMKPNVRKSFIEKLKTYSAVQSVSTANEYFGQELSMDGAYFETTEDENFFHFSVLPVDDEFQNTFNIKMSEGRFFKKELQTDFEAVILNEAAAREYPGEESIYGKNVIMGGVTYKVIGIVKDFNFRSLHHIVEPLVIKRVKNVGNVFVKVHNSKTAEVVDVVKTLWNEFNINYPLTYEFHDDVLAQHYAKDQKAKKLLLYLTLISLVIACVGLYAISFFSINKRIKEIGIRKVNGAKTSKILLMLNKDFIKWVAIAFVVACPIAYYGMNKWLENFAYKTALSWWIFALAGMLVLSIALLTVSWQSWRAATRNPVEALRDE